MDPLAVRDTLLDYTIRTLWAAVVVVIAIVLARAVRGVTMRQLTRHRAHGNATILLGNLAQLGVILLGILIVLAIYTQGAFGWILTSFSVVGIVIGLSLQDILRNFFAGVWVLVERPFRIGDTIDVSGYSGLVEEISFRTTQLRTADGRQVIVPNGDFMTKPVVNLTRFPLRRGVLFLALDAASELSTDAVKEALASVTAIARDPAPTVELRRVVNGKARYQLTFWAPDHDAAVSAAVAAVRTHFPDGEVRPA
ncbi:MAG TPA: mechanosensitive ion channel domain-containing protein [Candidatus Limnocylindria bacterium]|nr:mechanosensitive ion channel domain-containing protein [Candidatus Limnocylindria bacterium]